MVERGHEIGLEWVPSRKIASDFPVKKADLVASEEAGSVGAGSCRAVVASESVGSREGMLQRADLVEIGLEWVDSDLAHSRNPSHLQVAVSSHFSQTQLHLHSAPAPVGSERVES